MFHNGFHYVSMLSIQIEIDYEVSEITQYFRTSEVCPTLLHSSSCIIIAFGFPITPTIRLNCCPIFFTPRNILTDDEMDQSLRQVRTSLEVRYSDAS